MGRGSGSGTEKDDSLAGSRRFPKVRFLGTSPVRGPEAVPAPIREAARIGIDYAPIAQLVHADNLQAYLFASLDARARETLEPEDASALLGALQEFAQEAWPSFRYQNFDHERSRSALRAELPARRR